MFHPRLRAAISTAVLALLAATQTVAAQTAAAVTVKPFGRTPDGKRIHLYTLTNQGGMQVAIATYGGTVIKLLAPDRSGKLDDVALGFDTIAPYYTQTAFFGALIGRYCNRIGNARFTLDGKTYHLPKNNGVNTLHGGDKGFDKQLWNAEILSENPPSVRFSRLSPDGEEGFPGNLRIAATYTLTNKNELRIQYVARTDKPTVLNLTSHIYFNLAGAGNGSVLGQRIRIHASHYIPVDKSFIPTGEIKAVAGTPFDLRKMIPIGSNLEAVGGVPVGYDHTYVLDHYSPGHPALAAQVWEPASGRMLDVYTDQPGVQFYTGNFLDGTLRGKGGKVYNEHDAFCLETQHFPDSPNHSNFPSTVLRPGETFQSTTVYRFSTK